MSGSTECPVIKQKAPGGIVGARHYYSGYLLALVTIMFRRLFTVFNWKQGALILHAKHRLAPVNTSCERPFKVITILPSLWTNVRGQSLIT